MNFFLQQQLFVHIFNQMLELLPLLANFLFHFMQDLITMIKCLW